MRKQYIVLMAISLTLMVVNCSVLNSRVVRFKDAEHGQQLKDTPYTLRIESEDSLSLVHQDSGDSFSIVSPYSGTLAPKTEASNCDNCIATITANGKNYFLTRFDDNGSSGGFYYHRVFELTETEAIAVGRYESCGEIYFVDNQLTFPSFTDKCPEIIIDPVGDEKVETLDL